MTRRSISTRVNAAALARHFGVTTTYIRRLSKEAVIGTESDGKFDQDKSRLAYIAHLRSRRNIKAEGDASYRKLKNKKLQIEIATLEGELIALVEAFSLCDHIIGAFRAGLSGLPARITNDAALRSQIEAACDQLLTRLADEFERQAEVLQAGQSLVEVEAVAELDDVDEEQTHSIR
jgi:hypothetical protein